MKKWLLTLLILCALTPCAFAQVYTDEEQKLLSALESGTLIRLHVLAEDDSPGAQKTKLKVRDAILESFQKQLECCNDDEALYRYLCDHVEQMEAVARNEARTQGFEGDVSASVGVMELPEKQYGRVVLPKGEYRALRVTLGQGKGQNWWCILYPSLCLATAAEEPWQTEPVTLTFDSLRIFSNWLLWP